MTANDNIIARLFTNPAWMRDAPCAGKGDLFHPEQHGNGAGRKVGQAKAICAQCPHRVRCLEYAIDNAEAHGVWGGTSVEDRKTITRQRRDMGWTVGRYRKVGAACGTTAGYQRHHREGTDPCDRCREEQAAASARRRSAKGAAA